MPGEVCGPYEIVGLGSQVRHRLSSYGPTAVGKYVKAK